MEGSRFSQAVAKSLSKHVCVTASSVFLLNCVMILATGLCFESSFGHKSSATSVPWSFSFYDVYVAHTSLKYHTHSPAERKSVSGKEVSLKLKLFALIQSRLQLIIHPVRCMEVGGGYCMDFAKTKQNPIKRFCLSPGNTARFALSGA